jgi:hypothetical protein
MAIIYEAKIAHSPETLMWLRRMMKVTPVPQDAASTVYSFCILQLFYTLAMVYGIWVWAYPLKYAGWILLATSIMAMLFKNEDNKTFIRIDAMICFVTNIWIVYKLAL